MGLLDPPPFIPNSSAKQVLGRNGNPSVTDYVNTRTSLMATSRIHDLLQRSPDPASYNSPWKVPLQWVTATAYRRGNVVLNAGKWYVCAIAGTSGPNAPTQVSSTLTYDNTGSTGCGWTYYGPSTGSDDAGAPTLTIATTQSLTNPFDCPLFPAVYSVYGAAAVTFATNFWKFEAFQDKPGNTVTRGVSIAVNTNASKFVLGFGSNSAEFRVSIDGRYWSLSSFSPAVDLSGSNGYYTFDFGSVPKKVRRIVVETNAGCTFRGIVVGAEDDVWADADSEKPVRSVWISDSIVAGSNYGPWIAGGMLQQRVGRALGWRDNWALSTGGTGYINTNTAGGGPFYTYRQRIPQGLALNPDVWILFGSTNDAGSAPADVQTEALLTFQAIRAGSQAPIIVFGLWSINLAGLPATEAAVQAAVTAFNDPLTFFVPIYGNAPLPWLTGTWNNSAKTQAVNRTIYLSDDGIHPVDYGTRFLSEKFIWAIQRQVLPLIL